MSSHGYHSNFRPHRRRRCQQAASSSQSDTGVGVGDQGSAAGAANYFTAPPETEANCAPPSYGHAPPPVHEIGYFPPGTHPEIIRTFQAVDRDWSGFIDEYELQAALSSGYQKFSLGTIRLLMFLFGNPNNPSKIGPAQFAALWNCLGQWRAIYDRFDRDRSGKIDSSELQNALLSLGYDVPPSVIQVLMAKYGAGRSAQGALIFDSFVEEVIRDALFLIMHQMGMVVSLTHTTLLIMQVWSACKDESDDHESRRNHAEDPSPLCLKAIMYSCWD